METQLEAVLHHNRQVGADFALLTHGMEINYHKVLECQRLTERVVGDSYSSWIALCESLDSATWHKWVTWTVVATSVGFFCQAGNYFQDYDDAYESYWNRAISQYVGNTQ
ncbi:MAG: hypothetical protein EBU84_08520 [Actinobacteria bacterium]|nr:hypothetical protein [Actinomycetota bacterium]